MLFFIFRRRSAYKKCFEKNSIFYFDFSHRTTHLGDRLFYFPVIIELLVNNKSVILDPKDKITGELFEAVYGKKLPCKTNQKRDELIFILPKPSFLARIAKICRYRSIVITFDFKSNKNVVEQISDQLSLKKTPISDLLPKDIKPKSSNGKIALLSNYIDSGFFRKWFVNEQKLIEKCLQLKSEGYQIWHVGTTADKIKDKSEYLFVDKDLRGELSLKQIVEIIKKNDVLIVSYDNFLMHLGNIFCRNVFVLFRGRFQKKAVDFHMKCVNLCLSRYPFMATYL